MQTMPECSRETQSTIWKQTTNLNNDHYNKCNPVILEPICKVVVTVHPENVGDILSDLNTRRAKIIGMDINSVKDQKITCLVPESEILEYTNDLKAMTQGSGYFSRWTAGEMG